ncbi:hypothetical protein PHYSODRAFT_307478 [Phytophthora sojae]|uniref:Uncharacterized protein n=1 Tax=Phytophthora sojae (strain P6497) TaxID=1094619 RepID=G5AES2_PHYSP|nr:hypothetical protein PHYSODRAFT_307478 [Phytophthora sojae]EGZ05712.1 hypothetical protein PHYSODRAFT_307478 [Phytophthora sojae]|eukprot:XP_009538573.1 hypothetical protein PHYSODRAFT_307478 [Phytophthora sojae]
MSRVHQTEKLNWHRPSPTGGPCAMEILVTWLQSNYPAFARAAKSHQGHKLLLKLLRKMESSGHSGYTTDKIRSQINNLKCHATGQYSIRSLSSYNMRLREIFAQEQTSASGSSCEHLEQNDVSSSDSEAPEQSEDGGNGQERDGIHAHSMGESSQGGLSTTKMADRACIKLEPLGTRQNPIELDRDNDEQAENPQMRRQRAPPSSPSEVALIASILSERYNLKERGVPQAEIDKYLPLP